ncbi:hypothetical protein Poli38472_005984 [Pythium oligandrum]|uniref:HECT E3 ubiquitin ligase n=1 Tax=Pythium oligandrum TaxID=41045 RepID=A0A8K1CTV7_PYTOL|nr:hypothetical protein Poli38472_005984 [Pythium oligandrum]|eukprot:TMW68516.1 hypothetical protein Poli38472_005984 [Pythium oligandrum]
MGAEVSKATSDGADKKAVDAALLAHAWRHTEPFTLLQDELFVAEKFHEAAARGDVKTREQVEDAVEERTGSNDLSWDELEQAADLMRLKLLPTLRSADANSGSSATSLVKPSAAIVANDQLRQQRVQLAREYFAQVAASLTQAADRSKESENKTEEAVSTKPGPSFFNANGGLIAGSMFSIGSFRMQLQMLRALRVLDPESFSNGLWAIVETVMAFPDFALLGVEPNSMDDFFLKDVLEFIRIQLEQKMLLSEHRDILLLGLLVLGSSSGRSVFLLDFVNGVLRRDRENDAAEAQLIQGKTFEVWISELLPRLETYRMDYGLGTLKDGSLLQPMLIKAHEGTSGSSEERVYDAITCDASYLYKWDVKKGLMKIGTGNNFTVAGKVYARVAPESYLGKLRETLDIEKALYGDGSDVTSTVQDALKKTDASSKTIQQVLASDEAEADDLMTMAKKVCVNFSIGDRAHTVILRDDEHFKLPGVEPADSGEVKVNFAFYGHFESLNEEALTKVKALVSEGAAGKDFILTPTQLEEILSCSNLERATDESQLRLICRVGSESSASLKAYALGDSISGYEFHADRIFHSSLVYYENWLYLSLLARSSFTTSHSGRDLVRISSVDLSCAGSVSVEGSSESSSEGTKQPLVLYLSDGSRLFEVDISAEAVWLRKLQVQGPTSQLIKISSSVQLISKASENETFLSFFEKVGSGSWATVGEEPFTMPSVYSNGAVLCVMLPKTISSSKIEFECVAFSCSSGEFIPVDGSSEVAVPSDVKKMHSDKDLAKTFSRTLLGFAFCFDPAENVIWGARNGGQVLLKYRNPGQKLVVPDENPFSRGRDSSAASEGGVKIAQRIVKFLGSCSSDTCEVEDKKSNQAAPFVTKMGPSEVEVLLDAAERTVPRFISREATDSELQLLAACLRLLHMSAEYSEASKNAVKLDESFKARLPAVASEITSCLEFVESDAELSVTWEALVMGITTMGVSGLDLPGQLDRALAVLDRFKSGKLTRPEAATATKLVAQIQRSIQDAQTSVVITDDIISRFEKLFTVILSIESEKIKASVNATSCSDNGDAKRESVCDDMFALANCIMQRVFVHAFTTTEVLDVAIPLFKFVCRAVENIAREAIEASSFLTSESELELFEKMLRNSILAPVASTVFSNALLFIGEEKTVNASSGDEGEDKNKNDGQLGLNKLVFETVKRESASLMSCLEALERLSSAIKVEGKVETVETTTSKVKTVVMESKHDYDNDMNERTELRIPGAWKITITFDSQCRTEQSYDYVTFYKTETKSDYFGEEKYSGRDDSHNWPGVGSYPPLVIESDQCFVGFKSDGSNTDWGYKFTATGEILEKKVATRKHWLCALVDLARSVVDEIPRQLIDGSAFIPIDANEAQNDENLLVELIKNGSPGPDDQNANVLQLLRDFIEPSPDSDAAKVVLALQKTRSVPRFQNLSSLDRNDSISANPMNRAIRAVAAAILHHNMWGVDAYAFAQNVRSDLSEHLVRGWNNAQKMRDWFHMGDATDVVRANQAPPSSRPLRRQPSAFSGMTDEALETLCQNVIDRAQFLLELTPMTVSQVSDAKRRWSLLAKYGSVLSATSTTPETILQKWHNLVDEVQAVAELRSVLQYRRSSYERAKKGRVMSVIEQVLAFVQSDVNVRELHEAIEQRNMRAESRALGLQLFAKSWDTCLSTEVKGLLAESFFTTIKHMATSASSAISKHAGTANTSVALSSRVHYGVLLSGCDASRRLQVNDAFGACLRGFARELEVLADAEETHADVIVSILKALCLDFDAQDAYLLEESKLLVQVARFLGAKSHRVRRTAQTLLDIVLGCFVSRESALSAEAGKDSKDTAAAVVSPFQRQLYDIMSLQLGSVTAQLRDFSTSNEALAFKVLRLGGNRPGYSLSTPSFGRASHNHSISLWLRPDSVSPSRTLKVNDVVKRGPTWKTEEDSDENLNETGSVIGIVSRTSVRVQWKETKRISEHKYDPTGGVMDVVHVDHNLGGVVFCKGSKALAKAPGPWSHFGLYLSERNQLSYKIVGGVDKLFAYDSETQLVANEWVHIAVTVQDDALKMYANGEVVTEHELDASLVSEANLNAFPFYFGEPPGRISDEPPAECAVFEPHVRNGAMSAEEVVSEKERSSPPTAPLTVRTPSDRLLHILGLIRTCSQGNMGREVLATTENVGNLLFVAFHESVSIEARCASVILLQDLLVEVSMDVVETELERVFGQRGFVGFVLSLVARLVNVWSENVAKSQISPQPSLGISAQDAAALAGVYVSLLRNLGAQPCWAHAAFDAFVASLRQASAFVNAKDSRQWTDSAGDVLATLAVFGGSYSTICTGSRIKRFLCADNRETVETGVLMGFARRSGGRVARVLFDNDPTKVTVVPVSEIAADCNVVSQDSAGLWKSVAEVGASQLQEAILGLLQLPCEDGSLQAKTARTEMVEVVESDHPYFGGQSISHTVSFEEVKEIVVSFDPLSASLGPSDFVTFKKRDDDSRSPTHPESTNDKYYWGEEKYSSDSLPGVGSNPPLRIPAASLSVYVFSESKEDSVWGYRFTAKANHEKVVFPPESAPSALVNAINDIRSRALKAVHTCVQLLEGSDSLSVVAPLVPAILKIANSPINGQPTKLSSRSEVFESKHPYACDLEESTSVTFSGAARLVVTFDKRTKTEQNCDYVTFFKDSSRTGHWGEEQYSGVDSSANWPGFFGRPSLTIPSDSFTLVWKTDGSNVDWGWKFTVVAEYDDLPPRSLRLDELDRCASDVWELWHDGMLHQDPPLAEEVDAFEKIEHVTDAQVKAESEWDRSRALLNKLNSAAASGARETSSALRVICEKGVEIYSGPDASSTTEGRLEVGSEIMPVEERNGWLKIVTKSEDGETDKTGWIQRRSRDEMHVIDPRVAASSEDSVVPGVDDALIFAEAAKPQLNNGSGQERGRIQLITQTSYESFRTQIPRLRSFAYETHRSLATKHAQAALRLYLSYSADLAPVKWESDADVDELILYLVDILINAGDGSGSIAKLDKLGFIRQRIGDMLTSGLGVASSQNLIERCINVLRNGSNTLPLMRGPMRVFESKHPYPDDQDQKWKIRIPGAKKLLIAFDPRSKTETNCDWVQFKKVGSPEDEDNALAYSGRQGDENWPGFGGRPPLVIDADVCEVHFHSDGGENDWGYKFYAVGVFDVDGREHQEGDEHLTATTVALLQISAWLLSNAASVHRSDQTLPSARVYSAKVVETILSSLIGHPRTVRLSTLGLLTEIVQEPGFLHSLPPHLVERLRNVLISKLHVQDRVEIKTEYSRKLLDCAILLELAIDSSCFRVASSIVGGTNSWRQLTQTATQSESAPTIDKQVISLTSEGQAHHVQVMIAKVTGPFEFQIVGKIAKIDSQAVEDCVLLRWKQQDGGLVIPSTQHRLALSPLNNGDVITALVDTSTKTLELRKNQRSVIAVDMNTKISWTELTKDNVSSVRLQVEMNQSSLDLHVRELNCSPLTTIPALTAPAKYNEIAETVSLLLDFREQRASSIAMLESHHPSQKDDIFEEPKNIRVEGAVALEIRFDRLTKLGPHQQIRFSTSSSDNGLTLSAFDGARSVRDNPLWFISDPLQETRSLEVTRSSDWCYGDEDGGAGNVGVVLDIVPWNKNKEGGVKVRWKATGTEAVYRYGYDGFFDVQALQAKEASGPFIVPGDSVSVSFVSIPDAPVVGTDKGEWGYRFYVIPHFSPESIGRRRFTTDAARLAEGTPVAFGDVQDQQLVKYINKAVHSKDMKVGDVLDASWSDLAPEGDELVRWPTLVEIITGGAMPDSSANDGSTALSSLDTSEKLGKRFDLLRAFNSAVNKLLPFISFASPQQRASSLSLSDLISEQRHRVFGAVKRQIWDNALNRTNRNASEISLRLNRPKAMRHRLSGKTDMDGQFALFSQAYRGLHAVGAAHYRSKSRIYKVDFLGENATDAGGPYNETFAQYADELQSSQLPLLIRSANAQHNVGAGREKWVLNPGATSPTLIAMYEFLGKIFGVAIRSQQYMSINIANLIWKKMVGERVTVEDLALVDSMLVSSMDKIRRIDRHGVTEEMFEDVVMETFTTLSADNRMVELKPGGEQIAVTFASRCEFAGLVEAYRLREFDFQLEAILRGLSQVVPTNMLSLFTGSELELMVCGTPEIDIDLLMKCTEYSNCSEVDDHIVWFWEVMRDFSQEERSAFLRFVWGRSRLPVNEKAFPQRFKLQSFSKRKDNRSYDEYLPVSHTCFFSVEMPPYSSKAVLHEKLLYAIYNCQAIDGDGDSVAANRLGWEE